MVQWCSPTNKCAGVREISLNGHEPYHKTFLLLNGNFMLLYTKLNDEQLKMMTFQSQTEASQITYTVISLRLTYCFYCKRQDEMHRAPCPEPPWNSISLSQQQAYKSTCCFNYLKLKHFQIMGLFYNLLLKWYRRNSTQ
jgi:hypothetical protein